MTREEAIQILEEEAEFLYGGDEPYNKIAIDMAIEALQREEAEAKGYCHRIKPKEYLSADAEWIPCSERLPEKDGWYLITVQGYEKVVDMEWYYSEWGAWNGVSSKQQVIAWTPLPKPYKGGDTE